MIAEVAAVYPNFRVIATTLRTVRSATRNDWGAIGWSAQTGIVHATQRHDFEILDRVGGGDSFAAGLISLPRPAVQRRGADPTQAGSRNARHLAHRPVAAASVEVPPQMPGLQDALVDDLPG